MTDKLIQQLDKTTVLSSSWGETEQITGTEPHLSGFTGITESQTHNLLHRTTCAPRRDRTTHWMIANALADRQTASRLQQSSIVVIWSRWDKICYRKHKWADFVSCSFVFVLSSLFVAVFMIQPSFPPYSVAQTFTSSFDHFILVIFAEVSSASRFLHVLHTCPVSANWTQRFRLSNCWLSNRPVGFWFCSVWLGFLFLPLCTHLAAWFHFWG